MCELCGWLIGEYANWSRPGSEATMEKCRHCGLFLARAPGTLSCSQDIRGGLNFCLSSLDRASQACSSHPNYNPDLAFQDLTRYKESDIDPSSAQAFNLQPHKHPELLYTITLASFIIYGPNEFPLSCLRRAYHENSYIYQAFSTGKPDIPPHLSKLKNQLDFYFMYRASLECPWNERVAGWK